MQFYRQFTVHSLLPTMLLAGSLSLPLSSAAASAAVVTPVQTNVSGRTISALLTDGDVAFAAQDWQQYLAIYQQLCQLSPLRGEYWYRLGLAYRAVALTPDATQAFQKALTLGYKPGRSYFQLARLAAAAGRDNDAVSLFNQARTAGLTNAEQELMAHSEFRTVLPKLWPRLADDASDAEKWTADLGFLASRVEQSAYASSILKAQVSSQIRQLANQPQSAEERIFGIMRALRKLGSGHSQLYPPFQGANAFHAAPLRVQFFTDGLYVVAAKKPYQALLGQQVTAVGCLSSRAWRDAAAELLPHDSDSGLSFIASLLMVVPEYSRALGCDTAADQLTLTLQPAATPGGDLPVARQVQIPAEQLSMAQLQQMLALPLPDAQWHAVPRRSLPLSASPVAGQISSLYWYSPIPETRLMYWQLNQLRDDPAQDLTAFLAKLAEALKQQRATGLILDLRHNNGGNGELVPQILSMLQQTGYLGAAGTPAKLAVLTSGRTFSAAVLLAADLHAYNAIFVGEPTGVGAVHIGEENLVLLPNTGLAAAVATRLFVRSESDDKQPWIAPHLQVQSSFAQFRAGDDPGLATAIAELQPR